MMDDRNTTQINKTRELVQKEQTYDEPIINKSNTRLANYAICESVGCFSKAAIKLEVRVGTAGTIALFLCEECISKFRSESSDEAEALQLNGANAVNQVRGDRLE